MPTEQALARARKDQREGKSASTQAGEFVREEIERIREGVHGARSPEQAIAIGLSQARRAGIDIAEQKGAKATRKKPATKKRPASKAVSAKRRRASLNALKRENTEAENTLAERSATAKKAVRSKGPAARKAAAKKAAATRAGGRAAGAVRAARTRAMRSRTR